MESPRSACVITGVVHLAALGLAGRVLAPGTTAAADIAGRMAYVAADPRRWGSGWVAWMLGGITMVWLVLAIRDWLGEHAEPRRLRLATHLIVLGAALETVGHLLSAGMLPSLALAQQAATFAAVERTAELTTAASAFCFAPSMGLIITGLVRHPNVGRFTLGAGVLNVLAAYIMAFAHAASAAKVLPVASAAVVVSLSAFCFSLAREAGRRS